MEQDAVYSNYQCQHYKEIEKKFEVPFSCSAPSKIKNLGRKKFHYGEPFYYFNQIYSAYIRHPERSRYIGVVQVFLPVPE